MRKQLGVLLLVLAIAVGFLGTVAAQPAYTQQTYSKKTQPGYTHQVTYFKKTVTIHNFAFHPKVLIVKKGTTVTWRNMDHVVHTVTSNKGIFKSGHIHPGASYKFMFNKKGVYYYHCSIHPFMRGVIVVR